MELEFAKLEFHVCVCVCVFFFFLIPRQTYVGIFGLELEFVKLEFQNQSN